MTIHLEKSAVGTQCQDDAKDKLDRISDTQSQDDAKDKLDRISEASGSSSPQKGCVPSNSSQGSPDLRKTSVRSEASRRGTSTDKPVRLFSGTFSFGSEESDTPIPQQPRIVRFMHSPLVQGVSASLILMTLVLICMDTNARAQGASASTLEEVVMAVCFVAFVIEFSLTIYIEGRHSFSEYLNYVDAFAIVSSLVEYIMSYFQAGHSFGWLKLLRTCRLLRLGRLVRVLKSLQRVGWLKEVYILCEMIASCLRTLLWSFTLCFLVMTLWSVLAVELLHDLVVDIDQSDPELWSDCDRCSSSFASISASNLTFFQTIVAGDSWGKVALPVIERHPWSALIFIGAFSSILFGVLNLICAVVIDTFADRRAKNIDSLAGDLEYEEIQEKKALGKLFEQIDADGDGAVSKEELQTGARKVDQFRHLLRVLDIDDQDLTGLFDMIDCDGSGEVQPDEFIEALYRMKHTDPRTATRFVKHMVANLSDRSSSLDDRLDAVEDNVLARLANVEAALMSDLPETTTEKEVQDLLQCHAENIDEAIDKAIQKATAAALKSGMESAISNASHAIRKVMLASSNRTAAISSRVNEICGPISPSNGQAFERQISLTAFDPWSRQISSASNASNSRHMSKGSNSSPNNQLKVSSLLPLGSDALQSNTPKNAKFLSLSPGRGTQGTSAIIIELGE